MFLKLLLNVLSIATATNNIAFPSIGVTKSFDNKQRVMVDGVLLDLQDAATHNTQYFLNYCVETWPKTKVFSLLGDESAKKVPMTLAKTFMTIGKFATTLKKWNFNELD